MSDIEFEDEFSGECSEGGEWDSDGGNICEAASSSSTRKKSKQLRVPLVSCHVCRRPYYSLQGYTNHLKPHVLKDLYAAAPGREAMREFCRKASKDVLEEIHSIPVAVGLGAYVKTTMLTLLTLDDEHRWAFTDLLANAIEDCLPSSWNSVADFNNSFVSLSNVMLNDDEKCKQLKDVLRDTIPMEVPEEVLDWIFAQVFNRLCVKFECFYLQCLKEPLKCLMPVSSRSDVNMDNDNPDDIEFQRSVHYVTGSCVKSVLDMSYRSKSPRWLNIRSTIQSKMLAGELVNGPSEEIEAWTRNRDRGGLKFISESVYVFFMALTGVLKDVTEKDGSIPHENVLSTVKDDNVLILLWDNVVQGSLSEEDNDLLLKNACEKFVNAWGHGEVLKRKNAVAMLSRDKASLRSKLSK